MLDFLDPTKLLISFKQKNNLHLFEIEIKTFGLGSRIGDVALWDEPNVELSAKVCACYSVLGL